MSFKKGLDTFKSLGFSMKWFVVFFFLIQGVCYGQTPEAYYLTWKNDPSHSMMIFWLSKDKESTVFFRKKGMDSWMEKKGNKELLDSSSFFIHHLELTDLEEDTDYDFRIIPSEKEYFFHTLPSNLYRPLKVIIGGDIFLEKNLYEKMNQEVVKTNPDFVILGGDLAYTEGMRRFLKSKAWKAERWIEFLKIWAKDMITSEGRVIPFVPVIGNHDIREGLENPRREKIFFYQLFSFPEQGISYRTLNIGDNVCFFLLDSGHSHPVGGRQTEWLENAFKNNEKALYKIPVYHIAAYPSVAKFNYASAPEIRKFWVPLFEKYQVQISMENDNHAFKRTFPLLRGKIHENGVIYLGDGCWGVPAKKVRPYWYLEKKEKSNCFWLLTIFQEKCLLQAFNIQGKLIDEIVILPWENGKS